MSDIEFWTAIALLVVTVVLTAYNVYQQYVHAQRLRLMEVVVRDTQSLRDSLRKPLEGVWDYKLEYDKFHDGEGSWEATGRCILTWRASKSSYDLFFGAEVVEENRPNRPIVTVLVEGRLGTEASGWPEELATIDCKYLSRMGSEGCEQPSKPNFQYTELRVQRAPGGDRAGLMSARFETPKSAGSLVLTRVV